MERINLRELRRRVSWGSIIAGVVTVLAISVLISILTTSIGLFMFDPTSDNPTSGIGTTVGIWTAISLIISLIAGGFVAGKLAGTDGAIHGFLVWATTFIISIILIAFLAMGAVKLTSNILGSITSVAGNVLSGVGSIAKSGASGLSDQVESLFDNITVNTDMNGYENNLPQNIKVALRRSGVKELQPYYLQNQLKQVKADLTKTIKRLATHPKDADNIINGFLDRLQKRANQFSQNIDREDIAKAIANNTNLSQAEAENTVNQYIDIINNTIQQGKEEIENLQQSVENAKQEWEEAKQEALQKTEEASNAAARSGLISFFAMLVGAFLCSYAGFFGTRKTREGYEA